VVESAAERREAKLLTTRDGQRARCARRTYSELRGSRRSYQSTERDLSPARSLCLRPHHECIPCRKALKEARYGGRQSNPARRDEFQLRDAGLLRWAIAARSSSGSGLSMTYERFF